MGTLTYLTHLTELCWTENDSQAWVLPPNLPLRRQLTLVVLRRVYSLEVAPKVAITRLKAEANNSIKHIQVVLLRALLLVKVTDSLPTPAALKVVLQVVHLLNNMAANLPTAELADLKLLQSAIQAPTSKFYKLPFKRNNSRTSTHPVTRCWTKSLVEPRSRSPNSLPPGVSVPRSPLISSS